MDANCHKTPNEEDDLRNDFKKGDLSDFERGMVVGADGLV